MGMGDEVLVTGEVRALQERFQDTRPVQIQDFRGRARWHVMWTNNPRIAKPGAPHGRVLRNGARCRFYLDYARMRREWMKNFPAEPYDVRVKHHLAPWRFTRHKCKPGELYFPRMAPRCGKYIVIEPHNKTQVAPNRQWGWRRYEAVVRAIDADWLQINPRHYPVLEGVRSEPCATFVEACYILSGASLYVGPEGGLYHAAAALGVPAVAIFGGYVSPQNQGYDDPNYTNIYEPMGGASPCGQRVPCSHCQEAFRLITPDRVIAAIEEQLSRESYGSDTAA